MTSKMTSGETRGLITAIAVMAIVILIVAWNHGRTQIDSTETTEHDSVPVSIYDISDSTTPQPKAKKSPRQKVPKVYPTRNPLSEQIPSH